MEPASLISYKISRYWPRIMGCHFDHQKISEMQICWNSLTQANNKLRELSQSWKDKPPQLPPNSQPDFHQGAKAQQSQAALATLETKWWSETKLTNNWWSAISKPVTKDSKKMYLYLYFECKRLYDATDDCDKIRSIEPVRYLKFWVPPKTETQPSKNLVSERMFGHPAAQG